MLLILAAFSAAQSVLPKVFPSQAFRLRWLVDLNGTWRGVESLLHVGVAGVRLTQVSNPHLILTLLVSLT